MIVAFNVNCFTGQSRGFAFAQFTGIPEARRFLDLHYPSVSLHGAYDPSQAAAEPAKVRIAFSRDRDDRDKAGKSDDDWKCDVVCILAVAFMCYTNVPAVLPLQFLQQDTVLSLQCSENTFVSLSHF